MNLRPEIEAEITMLPADANPRKTALRDDITGYYGCPMILTSGNWDCRMVFPDSLGPVEFGKTVTALIQFMNPKEVLPTLRPGDTFQLWEMGIIATGKVKRIIGTPTTT
jgi:hypothetical protein